MPSKRSVFLLMVLFFAFADVFSQRYTLKTYTTNEGLPHNNVREIITDKSGYLWIATWDGVSRFDGYEFKNYHHIPGDSTSIPYFSVARIALDGSNNFWIQSDNGSIARFNRMTDDFSTIKRINGEAVCKYPNICDDEQGNIWIINDTIIFRYDYALNRYTRFTVKFPPGMRAFSIGYIFNLTKENPNTIWLASYIVFKLDVNEKERLITVLNTYNIPAKQMQPVRVIRNVDHITWYKIYIDRTGEKWLFSNIGLYKVSEVSNSINEFSGEIPLGNLALNKFVSWGNMDGSMFIYRPGDRSIIKIPPETAQMVKFICPAKKDVIWYSNTSFSGNSIGLTRLIFTPDYFKKYPDLTKSDNLPAVFSVTEDDRKNIWLGIRGRDYLTVITPDNKTILKYTEASKMPGLNGPVRSIKRTPQGLWIGYFDNLLLFYDYRTGSFKRYNAGSYLFRALEVRKDGKLYIGNSELILYDPATGKKIILFDSIPGGGNFRFHLSDDGTLWSGTPYGVVLRYDPAENTVKAFQTINRTNNIEDVCPADSSNIWLASLGGGLIKYNTLTGKNRVYTTSDGLSNNTLYSILRDKSGNIWASTDNGISRLNPSTGIIKNFGISEGLDIIEFNSGASFVGDDGKFYFGGMGGAVSFFPDSINLHQEKKSGDQIILTKLTVSGKVKKLNPSLDRPDTINLNKGEDNFHLTIATSDFAVSQKTLYRYRLIGHDRDWIVTDHNNRNINYDNLKPTLYRLEIDATNRDGEWSLHKSLYIRLNPFLYQRFIFKAALSVIITLIIVAFIVLYIRQLNQKARQTQDELRLQSLRGQMNPHFIFNSLNSINYFISNNDKLSANRYIADFARLIRSILSNMDSDYVSLTGEMQSVNDYLEIEYLRFGDKFDYEVVTSGISDIERYEVFPGLIQPFIENAIWHGVRALEDRKAFISIKLSGIGDKSIKCTIDDDGIGRKLSQELRKGNDLHNSRGIAIVNERLQIISKLRGTDYKLSISELIPGRRETGTHVEIDLPYRLLT